jgi:hypothetical protein
MASSASRWETFRLQRQFDAELRTNVVRIAAVGLLYTLHLLHHFSAGSIFSGSTTGRRFPSERTSR